MSEHVHRYAARCSWSGSTGAGYDTYDRAHLTEIAGQRLACSSDPAFLGDPSLLNPEQLILAAASSCQLLSFLAAAARARLDVLGYVDHAEAVMPEDESPMRITAITLRPQITVALGTSAERVRHLVEVAHRECFIANSLRSEIRIEATVHVAAGTRERLPAGFDGAV